MNLDAYLGKRAGRLSHADIMKLTPLTQGDVEQAALNTARMKSRSVDGIADAISLYNRILECVHLNILQGRPCSVAYLNRLFGRVAHRFKTRVTTIVHELLDTGALVPFEYGRKNAVVTAGALDNLISIGVEPGTSEYEETIEAWIKNTL